jgi:hypothetical protein
VSFPDRSGRHWAWLADAIIGAAALYVRAREDRVARMRAGAVTTGARALSARTARRGS